MDESILMLVNLEHPLPRDWSPRLTALEGGWQVDGRAAPFAARLLAAAKREGVPLKVCSAYRSVEYQERLFARRLTECCLQGLSPREALEETKRYLAFPGCSEHHTGLALDIVSEDFLELEEGFAETPSGRWLAENAWDFGFILRYPREKEAVTGIAWEPWHFRFVGTEHSLAIREKGLCLEEYLESLSRG